MAEALAAIALAGNVLQFLEAGGKLAFRACEILHQGFSGQGRSDLKALRQISHDLRDLLGRLGTGTEGNTSPALAPLATSCADAVRELLDKLDKIGVDRSHTRAGELVAEFKATWHKGGVEVLERRIKGFREELATHLVVVLRDLTVQSLAQQDIILSEIRALRSPDASVVATGHADAPGEEVMKVLATTSSVTPDDDDDDEDQIHLLRQQIHDRLVQLHRPDAKDTTIQDPNPRDPQISEERRRVLQTEFILSFHFRAKEYRASAISSPHEGSFAWIFDDNQDPARKSTGFRQWLASPSDKLFWLSGKPGSGKSTLVKYISSPREGGTMCRELLAEGAGSCKVATASFYFWASGAEIQSSQTALFKSLLFDLLQDHADVIPRIVPAAWESACILNTPFPADWTEDTLRDLVVRTVEALARDNTRVCLFIDGLDEFGGDPQSLLDFISSLLRIPNVKLCVSSRPWPQFQSAFSQASTLRMQDLTHADIQHVVHTRLTTCPGFHQLSPAHAAALTDQIVSKSAGVFLWVRLVLDTLTTALATTTPPPDLEALLRALPPELDDLYARLVDAIDPADFAPACRYFQLVLANDGSAEPMLLSFADEAPDFFRAQPFALMPLAAYTARRAAVEHRVARCCKGLLEVGGGGRVTFLHRTVRDFLDSRRERVVSGAGGFDAHLHLCAGYNCLVRATAFGPWGREMCSFAYEPGCDDLYGDAGAVEDGLLGGGSRAGEDTTVPLWITQCLHHAARVAPANTPAMVAILDSLSKKLRLVPELRGELAPAAGGLRRRHFYTDIPAPEDLLPLAVHHAVVAYLAARTPPGALCFTHSRDYKGPALPLRERVRGGLGTLTLRAPTARVSSAGVPTRGRGIVATPLLWYACFAPRPDPNVFAVLLDKGADVRFRLGNGHPWVRLKDGTDRDWYVNLRGCSMLEAVVGAALVTAVGAAGEGAAARAWSAWLPVLAVLKGRGFKLDGGLARAVVGRVRIWRRSVRRDPVTCLEAGDLVALLCRDDGDGAGSEDERVWNGIVEKITRPRVRS